MKEKLEDRNWELISKYLGNELTDNENEEFAKWLEESDGNRKELEHAEKIWQLGSLKESQLFDINKGWGKMQNRIHGEKGIQSAIRRHIVINTLKIAASLLILVAMAIVISWFVGKSNYINLVAGNERILKPIVLPDGSEVYLNTGSTLRYPKIFKHDTRKVELTGEAFFNVVHKEQQPFIIQTLHAQVKVLGTSFDVAAYEDSDSIQVVVETGTVVLSSRKADENVQLTEGNTGVYFTKTNKMVKSKASDINAFSWKTNDIIFHESNLDYVSQTLKRVFSKPIILDNSNLKKCRLNADFKNRDLESILEVIKETFNIEIKKTSTGYVLTGAGC